MEGFSVCLYVGVGKAGGGRVAHQRDFHRHALRRQLVVQQLGILSKAAQRDQLQVLLAARRVLIAQPPAVSSLTPSTGGKKPSGRGYQNMWHCSTADMLQSRVASC